MASFAPDKNRRVLPRFRSSAMATAAGDLCAVTPTVAPPAIVIPTEHFDALKADWKREQALEVAAELVCTASVLGRTSEVSEAARFLVDHRREIDANIVTLAMGTLTEKAKGATPCSDTRGTIPIQTLKTEELHATLSQLKRRLSNNPRNAIAWMDRAHLHTLLGQRDAAERAAKIATALAPDNRFVLRAASRFYVHINEKHQGLELLRRTRALRIDPWLMSAEIALATVLGTAPASLKHAQTLIKADSLQPWHTSELNGALGTLAMQDRSIGKPGQFFKRSLRDPTENAVAQAQWFANTNTGVTIPFEQVQKEHSPEAAALKARAEKRWPDVISACHDWMSMDPVSTRPLILGAFVACVAHYDGKQALPFTKHWLRIDPTSASALNNHAVALAYSGKLTEAREYFLRVDEHDSSGFPRPVYLATKGLLAFRHGDVEAGRKHYLEAADTPAAQNDPSLRALVLWHLLREEAQIGTPNASELIDQAWKRTQTLPILELDAMKSTIEKSLNTSLGQRLVATFQGPSSTGSLVLPRWD